MESESKDAVKEVYEDIKKLYHEMPDESRMKIKNSVLILFSKLKKHHYL